MKIRTKSALLKRLAPLRKKNKKIVFTNGCFDLLHVGHIRYLAGAKALGDVLVVGLNSDRSVRALKGVGRPLTPENERAEVLAALEAVDFITLFSEATPEKLIHAVRPDVLVKGGDWKKKDIVGSGFVESCGGRVLSLAYVPGRSTTRLIQKIQTI
ncbi:MAG: D-glycero-beta-D-manno-heptose 1-phosphate adenylyltransferase [Candidatus Omnitrophica bacterium]|nr:D-glycero-beta-D-manno-heptose 1-phosphate adenylyltransferase [Candidatus Omnitrophota bacterium]